MGTKNELKKRKGTKRRKKGTINTPETSTLNRQKN